MSAVGDLNVSALDAAARDILRLNDRGRYTVPTEGLYPYQWNWDSAFAAWGFATFDTDRAWVELESLMEGQWPSGMVPHILFHAPDPGYFPGPDVWGADHGPVPSSGISQPPVAASFARAVYEVDPDPERLRPLFARLKNWHRWFMQWRSDQGRVFITHPWEAGRDNAPDWDHAMAAIEPVGVGTYTRRDTSHVNPEMRPTKADYDRYIWLVQRGRRLGWNDAALAEEAPFKVADPTMTFLLLRANRDLSALAEALGEPVAEIETWTRDLEAGAALLKNDQGQYGSINLLTGQRSAHVSSASFLCWYAGLESPEMLAALQASLEACAYPVPSYDVAAPEFNPKRYWRGPSWGMINAMIARGLVEMGHTAEAAELRMRTAKLIAEHGFAEYFDPHTGEPAGGGSFTWTAAIWLTWASPSAGEVLRMGAIGLQSVEKWFGDAQVIKGVDLQIEDGEFVVFVGPSGCGKSTLLRMIGGLEDISRGVLDIDGRNATAEPPSKRGLAMVFQSYALYPHMSVRDNLGFSLKAARAPKAEIDQKVGQAADVLKLGDYLDRRPKDLSGGQRQRVAIGRCIVRDPTAFLFDEPLSNLDAALRVEMRLEIAKLHQRLGATMIYVTHDQVEAMTLADRIVVLEFGKIAQVGTPRELYERPANLFVAQFIGSPKMNILPCETSEGRYQLAGGGGGTFEGAAAVHLGVRPEHITLGAENAGQCNGTVDVVEYLGADCFILVDCGPVGSLTVRADGDCPVKAGERVGLVFNQEKVSFFDADGLRTSG